MSKVESQVSKFEDTRAATAKLNLHENISKTAKNVRMSQLPHLPYLPTIQYLISNLLNYLSKSKLI